MNQNKINYGSRIFDIVLVLFMICFSVIIIYPFINVVSISLSSNAMISSGMVTWLPKEVNTLGYEIVFGQNAIWQAYANTILYAFAATVISLLLTSMLAYPLMLSEFVLRKPYTILLLITMFFSGGTVPTYLVVKNLGIMNTMWSLVLPNAIGAFNVLIYKSFFRGISMEIREAARIDGAGEATILFRIYLPLSKALLATFALFSIVGQWNSFFEPLLYIKDESRQPIQMILRKVLFTSGAAGGTFDNVGELMQSGKLNSKNVQYACIVATIGPILLVYPFLQKYFAQGLQIGAVKG